MTHTTRQTMVKHHQFFSPQTTCGHVHEHVATISLRPNTKVIVQWESKSACSHNEFFLGNAEAFIKLASSGRDWFCQHAVNDDKGKEQYTELVEIVTMLVILQEDEENAGQ